VNDFDVEINGATVNILQVPDLKATNMGWEADDRSSILGKPFREGRT
jgi:hypothetical protein